MSVAQRYRVNCFAGMGMKALLVLLVAASASSGLEIELKIKSDPQCMFKGQQCNSDRSQIIYCSGKGGDSYVVQKCESGAKCLEKTSGNYVCSKKETPKPPVKPDGTRKPFICSEEGFFPEASQCNIGYLCESAQDFPKYICECPEGSALITTPGMSCTNENSLLEECKCPTTDRCTEGVGTGSFGSCHPQHFYLCKNDPSGGLSPEVLKCPPGQYFVDGKCQGDSSNIKVVEQTGNAPVCKEYPCMSEANVKCTKKGELLPHGKVDRCYYYCDGNLKPVVKDCGVGSYFTCKYGQCGCVFGSKP